MSTTADNKSSSSGSTNGPDIKQLAGRELPKANFPADGKSEFRIALDDKVHKEIQKHAKENKQVEICGVLVGKLERDDKGPFVHISGSIRGEAATNKFAEVTFTHDTWSKINAEMDKNFAGYNMVGWYHTHPDFGIFLSERDRFIHESFFSDPGHVAYVVDPVRDIEGFFIWQGGKPVPAPHYWTGEKLRFAPAEKDPRTMSMRDEKRGGSSGGGSSSERGREEYVGEGPLGWLTLLLGGLCLFMLGFLISNWYTASQASRLLEAIVTQQQLEKVRLTKDIEQALQSLQAAGMPLAGVQNSAASLPPQVQTAFHEAAQGFNATAQQLIVLRKQYGIDEHEFGQLAMLLARKQQEIDAAMNPPTTNPSAGSSAASAVMGGSPSAPPMTSTTQPTTTPAH